ncbi:MAG TPA: tetratricopeptide repeat protein [Terriglobales bacterium]|nr:tetratricopeptide repeat protein [Terriglobales bacterium]
MRGFRPGELFDLNPRAIQSVASWVAFCVVLVFAPCVAFSQLDHVQNAARLLDQGQLQQADAEAQQALTDPKTRPLGLAMLGTIRLQQNQYKESEHFLTEALRLNPNLVGARLTLGDAYVLQNRLADGRKSFQEALARAPSNFDARFHLAKVESLLLNFQRSLDLAKPVESKLKGTEDGLLLLATDYGGLGKKEELNKAFEAWQQLPAHSDDVAVEFGLVLAHAGMQDQAKEVFKEAEENVISHAPAAVVFKLAEGYSAIGSLDRAEEYFALALRRDPECSGCDLALAQIAEKNGIDEKALAYLIAAKKLDPENPDILFEFGRVCLMRNLTKDAVPALEKAAQLRPDRDTYVYELASAYVGLGNLSEAESLFKRLLKKHPQDANLIYAMGAVYYLEGRFVEAQSSLKRSLEIEPNRAAASYYLGLTYDTSGDDEQAVAVFQDLLKRHPEHGLAHVKLGAILLRQHKYEEARRNLEKAISLLPNSQEAHYQLGVLLRRTGNTAESEHQFDEARKLESDRTHVRLQLLLPN